MKVAFDARELSLSQPPAGIGRYIQGIFGALPEVESGLDLYALCHNSHAPFPHPDKYHPVDMSDHYFGKWSQTLWEFLSWNRAIDRLKVDLFHSTAHLVPRRGKTPMVLTVHDLTNFLYPRWYRFTNQINRSWNLKRGIKNARKIIAVSEATRRDLCKLFPKSEEKIEVIYEGVDPIFKPYPENSRQELGLGFEEPFILWAGTTSPRKNLPVLLKAFEQLHQQIPDIHLVLLGQRGWKDQEIFDYIQEKRLRKVIHPMGYQPWEALPLFYSASSVFVFPSLYEGFGLPVVEAMACGTPVIASNTSSLPELLPDEQALFDPNNPEELVEKLRWIIGDASVAEGMSEKGLVRAKEFDWRKAARQTLDVYHKALE